MSEDRTPYTTRSDDSDDSNCMRDYQVTITSWPAIRVTVSARSHNHAKSLAWQDASDAGWQVPFVNFRAKLAR